MQALLITPDVCQHEDLFNIPLFEYEQVLLVPNSHPLAKQEKVSAHQLQDQVLFTFPIEKQRLDIFNQFLEPENITPKAHKTIESVAIMLQMVSHQRGVCVLPEWLAGKHANQYGISKLRLGNQGLFKTLYPQSKSKINRLITYSASLNWVKESAHFNFSFALL